jgi:hypothetical protein
MTDTTVSRTGCSVPRRPAATSTSPLAEAAFKPNIEKVGLPTWTRRRPGLRPGRAEEPRQSARRTASPPSSKPARPPPSRSRRAAARTISATSPGPCRRSRMRLPGQHPRACPATTGSNAIAMATPDRAHKGVVAGSKVDRP